LHAAITRRQDIKYHAIQRLEIIEASEFLMQSLGQLNVQLNNPESIAGLCWESVALVGVHWSILSIFAIKWFLLYGLCGIFLRKSWGRGAALSRCHPALLASQRGDLWLWGSFFLLSIFALVIGVPEFRRNRKSKRGQSDTST
jgi:hypothetical protein